MSTAGAGSWPAVWRLEVVLPNLIRSTLTVGGNTLASRILGFVRDLVVARVFGADAGTDAFFVAFKIPNFLRRLFAEGAFSMAFVPVLTDYRVTRSAADLRRLADEVAGMLATVLAAVTALGVLAAPVLILVFAPGFAGAADKQVLAADMLRLTFPYLLFVSLTALAAGLLNTFNRFAVPALTPALLNLSLIGCALWLAPLLERPIMALAWGVFIGGAAQLAFQLPFLWRLGLLPRPRLVRPGQGVRRILRLMVPALLGASVAQVSMLLDTLFASFLEDGSISWLYYSNRLVEFPLGVLGVALGTVILPHLSARFAQGSQEGFSQSLDWGLRWVLFLGLPAAVGLSVLAQPMIITLFGYGAFTETDAVMTSRSLVAYALGLVGFMAVKVLAPAYYARQDLRAPVRIALAALGANLVLNLVLIVPLGHAGLALATTLAATLNGALLFWGLLGRGLYLPLGGWPGLLWRGGVASFIMAVVLFGVSGDAATWMTLSSGERVRWLVWCLTAGAGAYLISLLILGIRPRHLGAGGVESGA